MWQSWSMMGEVNGINFHYDFRNKDTKFLEDTFMVIVGHKEWKGNPQQGPKTLFLEFFNGQILGKC